MSDQPPPPPYGEKGGAPQVAYPPQQQYPPQQYPPVATGGEPPQQQYPPQQYPGGGGQVIVVQQPHFDRYPVQVTCPGCHQLVQSRVQYEIGTATWLIGCFVCVCAFCIDACKDAMHVCPSCNHVLGRKNLI